ncbi:iron-sulfur cluster co-chaperone HscB C-terminal domain-containing protein [Pedobacter sp. Du54]|uniref:iron-sulfur cluster co-chaperone HscB C-terminal domain-containing protein n=1 Tax=Pedobacter anseongensis TaxID=3133439 RepID=UPI0030991D56
MNYFDLYEIPISFNPNQEAIKEKFYALSKKYHPDFYINESQEKQDEVLELSTLNNKAFQVLKDDQQRLHYILELKGQLIEGENYSLPQSFLMEMMDVNEAIMELTVDSDKAKKESLVGQISDIENLLSSDLKALTSSFDRSSVIEQEERLKAIKDVYYRNKYLGRIKESLAKFTT